MQIQDVEVRVLTATEINSTFGDFAHTQSDKPVVFLTPKQFASVFSEKRMELVNAIQRHPHYTVNQLAALLKRKQEAISRDLGVLRSIELVINTPAKPKGALNARTSRLTHPKHQTPRINPGLSLAITTC